VTKFLRIPGICERRGKGRSSIYQEASDGLLPRFVNIGGAAVGLPEHEVDAVNDAYIAGATEEQIRRLVVRLEQKRSERMPAEVAA
jgi:prophage regulatory protein